MTMIPTPDTRACIRTRFIGASERRGARITVTDDRHEMWGGERIDEPRRLTMGVNGALGSSANHYVAAVAWLAKYNPEASIVEPGLGFKGEYYWTWE